MPHDAAEVPHPFVPTSLARHAPGSRTLLLGVGGGRNLAALLRGRHVVVAIEPDDERARDAARRFAAEIASGSLTLERRVETLSPAPAFDVVLSTHGLLHGSRAAVGSTLDEAARRLHEGGELLATFGSTRDARYAASDASPDGSRAPREGREAGVAHVFFDRGELAEALARAGLDVASCTEESAAESAGAWAHDADEAAAIVHWFVRAERRVAPRGERLTPAESTPGSGP